VRRIRVIGIGPGDPDQVTLEAVAAMHSVAYSLVAD
jgi:precorrin-6A synthase